MHTLSLGLQLRRSCLIYNKKAGLHYCCSAIRGSSMTFNPEQTTLKPTPICIYTLLYLQYSRATLEYISRGHHNAAMLWDFGLIC